MILAKVHTTPKQRDEFRLLVAIRFACLMALAKGHTDPMDCPRVQARCAELVKHFAYHHPSPAFTASLFATQANSGSISACALPSPSKVCTAR